MGLNLRGDDNSGDFFFFRGESICYIFHTRTAHKNENGKDVEIDWGYREAEEEWAHELALCISGLLHSQVLYFTCISKNSLARICSILA
jgi:hypothetical protein